MADKVVAFKMKLNPGQAAAYKKRHDGIWPELKKELRDAGVYDYNIFLDEETNILFAVQKVKEGHDGDSQKNVTPTTQKWWDMMADIMEVNPDNSPVSIELKQMFHFD